VEADQHEVRDTLFHVRQ